MFAWNNNTLLASIRFRAGLASTTIDEYFTDANLLQLLNEELTSWLTPMVLEMRSEYLINSIDYAIGSNGGNAFYIPSGAVAGRLRCLRMCDGGHNPVGPQLEQIDIKDARNLWGGIWGSFFFKDNAVVLTGVLPQGYYLRMDYEGRLSTCVSPTACAQITAISGTAVTVASIPSGYTSGVLIDFIAGSSPFTNLGTAALTAPSGNTFTFAAALPSAQGRAVQVGDWIALTGTSPFIALPQEVVPLVAQWMAVKCQEIKGDQKIDVSQAKYKEVQRQVVSVLAPRSLGNKKTPGSMLGAVMSTGFFGWPGGGV